MLAERIEKEFLTTAFIPSSNFSNAEELHRHFTERERVGFLAESELRRLSASFKDQPAPTSVWLEHAEKICRHMFDLLGSGNISHTVVTLSHPGHRTGHSLTVTDLFTDL